MSHRIFKLVVLLTLAITFVNCRKDNVQEPPPPIDFASLSFQYEYSGTEQFIYTAGGWLLTDSSYDRAYSFFATEPDTNFRYLKFYTGVIDTLEVPLSSFADGHYSYSQASYSEIVCPEYSPDSSHYSTLFEFDLIDDSIYFHLFDFKDNYLAYHYYFSGVKQ